MIRNCLSRLSCVASLLIFFSAAASPEQQSAQAYKFPYPEKLTYQVEWRMITAGTATIQQSRANGLQGWNFDLHLETSGLVTRLYRVLDTYKVTSTEKYCGVSSLLDAQEGKKHQVTKLSFDNFRHKVLYDERDLIRNVSEEKELDSTPCTYEIMGALAAIRTLNLEPGKSIILPITDGKKSANAKIEAQGKENITAGGKSYQTTRYEAFLFDNVLYKRKGRLFIWISDDADRLPVLLRLQMGFPVGSVAVELQKQEKQ